MEKELYFKTVVEEAKKHGFKGKDYTTLADEGFSHALHADPDGSVRVEVFKHLGTKKFRKKEEALEEVV